MCIRDSPIVVGEATKFINYIPNNNKTYEVKCKLGVFSQCGDYETEPVTFENETEIINNLSIEVVENTFKKFLGKYPQMPPMFSASKHKGKPLYTYARKNITVKRELKEKCIFIHLTLIPYLSAAGELKTKPTQHSVKLLLESGIQPDILVCRTERELSEHFCFYVPGYKFMPAYRNRVWDGKIRLFDMRKKTLYVGLHRYLEEFCEERDYNLLSDINLLPKYDDDLVEGMLEETTLPSHISPRDYQLNALRRAIRSLSLIHI